MGWFVDDVVITREEIRRLMEERLYVNSGPLGATKLSDWVRANRLRLGLKYTSEMDRRWIGSDREIELAIAEANMMDTGEG